jgi:hypothetical protein
VNSLPGFEHKLAVGERVYEALVVGVASRAASALERSVEAVEDADAARQAVVVEKVEALTGIGKLNGRLNSENQFTARLLSPCRVSFRVLIIVNHKNQTIIKRITIS